MQDVKDAGASIQSWMGRLTDTPDPVIDGMVQRFLSELARTAAEWFPVLAALAITAFILIVRGRANGDLFDDEDEEGRPGLPGPGFMFGRRSPLPLQVRSWNRQVDRFEVSMVQATQGKARALRTQQQLREKYTKLQDEVARAAEAEQVATSSQAKAPDSSSSSSTSTKTSAPGRVWVLDFKGDIMASGVEKLRKEITAVVMNADSDSDEVVIRLDSPGGTVTGYGLAGAQLMRLRDAGLRITVAIDQVAASGGYLMACVAHRIICSPFAIIGSIGVVSELPVVYERLKKEGVVFETTTAGKYKRTLTPFREPTEEDRAKTKQDIEDIFGVFRDFVKERRPSLDIEAVATGETWLGPLAKDKGLVDDLLTSDSLLVDYMKEGHQIFEVSYNSPSANPLRQLLSGAAGLMADAGARPQDVAAIVSSVAAMQPSTPQAGAPHLRATREQLWPYEGDAGGSAWGL